MRESLFFVSVVIASVTFIFIWIMLVGPMKGEEKTYVQDSTTFAIVVMVLLLIAFIAVTTTVLFF
ncbi:hypothetical protein B1H42_12540 [Enterobacter cloacae subsp. cloacae]|uniref:Uncharacterized protein n=1 Tax=Enterobacter cloacae TaxID=550 RepID=A0A3R8YYX8_ENTCL|nr:hypothetical protein [Enterobacter cloacae]KLQ37603.1 hypothetical protein ABR32_19085 [Enterobacter cloacae subsp. dissolvens]MBW4200936.1 hypothetical protein [Enterobacter cloacae subsp. cloacae]RTQ01522.1 hypothetical protein EKN38_10815 [Enterobacter sp. WCHEn045836]ELE9013788.1 hypothetical protein [Enterobacter cloacae]